VTVLWRNPDVNLEAREFEVRDEFRTPTENFNMPKMITASKKEDDTGIYLGAESRSGSAYCPLYQQGKCNFPPLSALMLSIVSHDGDKGLSSTTRCKLGEHKCAALCRGGRLCGGNHAGMDCRNKKQWKPAKVEDERVQQQAEGATNTALQLIRPCGPMASDPPAKKARVIELSNLIDPPEWPPKVVTDSSIMDKLMKDLITKRQPEQGRRLQPEAPTMIAKICAVGGELWIGPVPTNDRLERIMEMKPSIQVCCFKKSPTEVLVDDADPSSHGVLLPDTEYFRLEMSNDQVRKQDLRKLRTTLLTSMRQGDNTYAHCMTGLCRAAIGGSLLAALLMNEEISCSMSRVDDLRNVQMDKAWRNMGGPWIDRILNEECVVHPESNFFLVGTDRPSQTVVHAGIAGAAEDEVRRQTDDYPLCKWKRGGNASAPNEHKHMVRCGQPEQAVAFSDTFCKACWPKLSSSRRVMVQKVFARGVTGVGPGR
jgi:hypothetical protein